MGSRGWWSVVIGIAAAVGFAVPAAAAETTFADTCADVYGHRAIGDLDKTTDPAAGSEVTSGQSLTVTLQWPTFAVAGERTHRVMDCLSIDGGSPRLWAERQFSSAAGTVTFSEVVPAGLAPRSTVCGQSFLKTQGSFGPVTRWSEKTCHPVGSVGSFHALSRSPSPPAASPSPDNRATPTTRGPISVSPVPPPSPSPSGDSSEYQAPWPPWEKTPKVSAAPPVATTPTTTAPLSATPAPRKSSGTQSAAPAPPSSTRAPSQTLPRTGAGVVVLVGVAAVALFSGRTLRKASDHIADNLPVPAIPLDDDDEPTLILGRRW